MTKYLAGVLTVIAVGVLLVAYGLLNAQAPIGTSMQWPQVRSFVAPDAALPYAALAGGTNMPVAASSYAQPSAAASFVPVAAVQPAIEAPVPAARPVRAVDERQAPRRVTSASPERQPQRNWKKTALIIGGSSASGAGIGAIFGGKKGALIGAAIAGGASTIYEIIK
jgi:hypothetical protein